MNRDIVCIGVGCIGGPMMAVIAKNLTLKLRNCFFKGLFLVEV